MAAPQLIVIGLVFSWGAPLQGAIILLLLIGQGLMMRKFLAAPIDKALWYSGFGVPLFVLGMMASASAARMLTQAI
jgi:chlorophyll synthase